MTLEIRAALALGKGQPLALEDVELDAPRPGEVLVRVVATGLCETDLMVRDEWYPVPLPVVLGHEGAGTVEAVGEGVRRVAPGDHVVVCFSACGACAPCRVGKPAYCEHMLERNLSGRRPDGSTGYRRHGMMPISGHFFGQSSFATYSLADESNVVKVPRDAPLELLGPLGCGVQAGAGAVLWGFRPPAGSSMAVFGAGLIGISAVMAARVVGCTTIIAVDPDPRRQQLATALGATRVVDPREDDVVKAIRHATGNGVNYSVETSGNAEVLRAAVDATAAFGVCGVIGPAPVGSEVVLDVNMLLFGRSVRGLLGGDAAPADVVPVLTTLYQQGRFPFDRLMRSYAFEDINAAIDDVLSGEVLKPIIRMVD